MKKKRNDVLKGRKGKEKSMPCDCRWLRHYGLSLVLFALFVAWGVMTFHDRDFLWRVEELNLFLYTSLFFKQQMVVPGGLLTYIGTYFTQFLYYPWLGSLLFCAWCGWLLWLVQKTFRLPVSWAPALLAILVLVLLTNFDLGYWVFVLKLRGYFFATVVGLSMAVALVWLFRLMPIRYGLRWAFMALAAVGGYMTVGWYGLLAVWLMAVISWRLTDLSVSMRVATALWALVLTATVPLACYHWIYYQSPVASLWVQGLPIYEVDHVFFAYYWPYLLLLCLFVAAAIHFQQDRAEVMVLHAPKRWVFVQACMVLAVAVACWFYWYDDSNFHSEQRMAACLDQGDWEGVVQVARESESEPTRLMVMNKNLALFKLGRAGDELYHYRDGAKAPVAPFEVRMVQMGGKMLYLQYGLPNYCYRWCMEDGVEYGWRVEHLKFFVRCALLNNETMLAQKFIDMLKKTRFHRRWAEQQQRLIHHAKALANDPQMGAILPLMHFDNMLTSDNSFMEIFLLNMLSRAKAENALSSELVLLAALQMKDIPTFWNAFFQYAQLNQGKPMPRHFQEAAYLYGQLEHQVDISHMPFDESVKADYQAFVSQAQQSQNMTEDQMRQAFYPSFGHTFFYNYFLMRDMKSN